MQLFDDTPGADHRRPRPDTDPATPGPIGTWATYVDHEVLDDHGNKIGTVTDVIYDEPGHDAIASDPQPTWLVVDPGLLRSAHYVPVAGSYRSESGAVVVPWDKDWIKSALKAKGDHLLSRDDRAELAQHYALAD